MEKKKHPPLQISTESTKSSGKGSTCCPWIWSHGSIKVSSMLKRLLKAATRYGAGGFTSPIRNQRGKSLDLVFGWWIVVGLRFTYSILNYTLGIFFGRLDEIDVLWSCGEFIQNLQWKYQSDFICQVGDGCSFLTLECQEFGQADQSSNLVDFIQNPREGSGELVLAIPLIFRILAFFSSYDIERKGWEIHMP